MHVNGSSGAAVGKWVWPGGPANFLFFQNTGTAAITLSFTQADADAGIGYSVANGSSLEIPAEIGAFYTKSAAAQTFQAIAFVRRG